MSYCEDCGTRLNGSTCPNCHEELFIIETQCEYIDYPLSDEFLEKADRQSQQIKERKSR